MTTITLLFHLLRLVVLKHVESSSLKEWSILRLVPFNVEMKAEKPIGMRYSNIRTFSPKEIGMS